VLAQKIKKYPPIPSADNFVSKALFNHDTTLISNFDDDAIKGIARNLDHEKAVLELNPKSFISVPMMGRGKNLEH